MNNSVYKTILLDADQGTQAPVLVVGVENDEVFITISRMTDGDERLSLVPLTPEITVSLPSMLGALGMVAQAHVTVRDD